MEKFKDAKVSEVVYSAKAGKGTIAKVEKDRIITVHNMKSYIWGLDGKGVLGQLHYFGNKES